MITQVRIRSTKQYFNLVVDAHWFCSKVIMSPPRRAG